jgi:hypothetical protein
MAATIVDGKQTAASAKAELKVCGAGLGELGHTPGLATPSHDVVEQPVRLMGFES